MPISCNPGTDRSIVHTLQFHSIVGTATTQVHHANTSHLKVLQTCHKVTLKCHFSFCKPLDVQRLEMYFISRLQNYYKKAVLPQGNRAMLQVFFSVEVRQQHSLQV